MKRTLVLCILLAAGCTTKQLTIVEPELQDIDSIVARSEHSIEEACTANQRVDSVVREGVVKINNHITEMNQQMQKLRVTQKVETVRVDTVYVETKKNFWGREKTKTTVVSNTTTSVDSTEN